MAVLPHCKKNSNYLGLIETAILSNHYDNALDVFYGSDLLFEPRTDFYYSSFNTVLLSAAMQEAAQEPYLDLMKKQVFHPLEMSSTMAEAEGENSKNLATFYWNNRGELEQVKEWRNVDLSHGLAGGGFISTSTDLVKMGAALLMVECLEEPKAFPWSTLSIIWYGNYD